MPLAAIDSIRTLDDDERKEIRDRVEAASNKQAERFIEEVLAKSDRRYDGIPPDSWFTVNQRACPSGLDTRQLEFIRAASVIRTRDSGKDRSTWR